jgi:hypothetical protein
MKPVRTEKPSESFKALIAAVVAADEKRIEDEATRVVRAKLAAKRRKVCFASR